MPTVAEDTHCFPDKRMLKLLLGAFGTGKTTRLFEEIAADIAAGIPSFLVVPEQNTVIAEKAAALRLPESAPLIFEVTNFTRLADTVFRRVGGVSTRYANGSVQALLAREAIGEVAPLLSDRRRADTPRTLEVLTAIRECTLSAVTPDALQRAADELGEGVLSRKLRDLSLLLASFRDTALGAGYSLPTDALERLREVLAAKNPLAGAHFYFDGFTSFTALQRGVLSALLRSCRVTVALPVPDAEHCRRSLAFAELKRTLRDLRALALRDGIELEEETLTENRRARHRVLAEIGERLFTVSPPPLSPPMPKEEEALSILECRTPFDEAELVAADIARRVREGARYSDHLIVARSAEAYRGVLDAALLRYGIPAHFSLSTDLLSYEATKLIRAAYAAVTDGGRREDVIPYIKCALTGIPRDDVDRFELYAERWGLTGRRLLDVPFTMYATGYSPPRSERERKVAEEELAALNKTRLTILEQLSILRKSCKENLTVKEHAAVLYEFLSSLSLDEKLYEKAKLLYEDGDAEAADAYSRLFGVITDALDLVVELSPDTALPAREFSELLLLLFSSTSLRSIPARADAVTVGSADLLRAEGVRHVYLIGVNADVFPRGKAESGTFTQPELETLLRLGIVLDADETVRASREYFCFLRAFSAAAESVTISYYLSDFSFKKAARSEALDRILAMTDHRFPIKREAERGVLDGVFTLPSALRALAAAKKPDEREALLRLLSSLGADTRSLLLPLSELSERVDREVMRDLLSGKLSLTQSRIDRFVSCPFSYFCEYVLRLSDNARILISSAEVGTFVHAVLEYFFREVGKERFVALSDEEIAAEIERISKEYLTTLFPAGSEIPARLSHRFMRLVRRATAIALELRLEAASSAFSPLFFEYEPSAEDENAAEPPSLTLDDGTRVTLYGKIDRVDVYRNEKDVYLRVVDYKTGEKLFSLDDVRAGKSLQMLIYLFALWLTEREGFRRTVGLSPEGRLLPAGALYLNLSLKGQRVGKREDKADALCTRSGLLLADPESLRAMDRAGEGRFIPVTLDEDGMPKKGKLENVATLDGMRALADTVGGIVRDTAERIAGGCADATPMTGEKSSPCEYCPYFPVCRAKGAVPGEEEGEAASSCPSSLKKNRKELL